MNKEKLQEKIRQVSQIYEAYRTLEDININAGMTADYIQAKVERAKNYLREPFGDLLVELEEISEED